jgi:hypothetical protein
MHEKQKSKDKTDQEQNKKLTDGMRSGSSDIKGVAFKHY